MKIMDDNKRFRANGKLYNFKNIKKFVIKKNVDYGSIIDDTLSYKGKTKSYTTWNLTFYSLDDEVLTNDTITDKATYKKFITIAKQNNIKIERKHSIVKIIVISIFCILATLGVVVTIYENSDSLYSSSTGVREMDAWNCATDVVKKELYNYSNIKVSSYSKSTVFYNENTQIYTIKGEVSYTNAFGAKVNNKFTVNLELTTTGYKNSSVLIY